jgi:small subunit ribosomal protein S1
MIDKGVIVELPALVDGFVPLSHLAKTNLAKPADGYAVGDELELVVIEFNKDNKKIILSEKLTKEPHGDGGKRKRGRGKPAEAGAPEVKLTPEELAAADEVLSDTVSPVMEVAAETPAPEFTLAEPEPQA